jgi:hypothetical protein
MGSPAADEQLPGFWGRILELLRGPDDPERVKRRLLKAIAHDVKRDRAQYYVATTGAAGPGVAKFIHGIYLTVGPAQTLLEAASSSEALRTMVVESCLTEQELAMREGLTEEAIAAMADTVEARRLVDTVKKSISAFTATFSARIPAVNARMRDFWTLLDLVAFDYQRVLRRFDPALPRADYRYVPTFSPVNADQVAGDLRDLLEILAGVDAAADWGPLFDTLKHYRRIDAISRESWRKLLRSVERLGRSGMLLNVLRLLERDPYAKVEPRAHTRRGAEEYLEKVRTKAEAALHKTVTRKRSATIDEMIRKVFGRAPDQRLTCYAPAANPGFEKRGVAGYAHAVALNLLAAYITDYAEKEVKILADLLLVKGMWSSTISSRAFSESVQALLAVGKHIAEFDGTLADDGPRGQKVKIAMVKSGRNKSDVYMLKQAIRLTNESARALLSAGIQGLVELGRQIKGLIDDMGSRNPRIVTNWRDLDAVAEMKLRARSVAAYTRLYNLVKLLGEYRDGQPG